MKQLVGKALSLIGILGFVVLLATGMYSVFGWVGVGVILCIVSFISGMLILDEGKQQYED